MEYAGELIDRETGEDREAEYKKDTSKGSYMYFFSLGGKNYW